MSARPRPSDPAAAAIADTAKQLQGFNVGKLLREGEVVTPVANFQQSITKLGGIYGLNRPRMMETLLGLSTERRSLLSTALGATTTAAALRDASERRSEMDSAISRLATIAGVNARVDLSQQVALGLGIKTDQFYRLPQAFSGDPSGLSAALKKLSESSVVGIATKRHFDRWIVDFKPHLKDLFDLVERLAREREDIAEGSAAFVERYGWPLPLALPPSALQQIIALTGRTKPEVRKALVSVFAPKTQAFLYSRDALMESEPFQSRKRPIEQAVRALRRKDHYAAICTMLPLIEGVLIDVAFGGHFAGKGAVKKALDKLAPPGSVEETWALQMIEALLLSGAGGVALFSNFDRKDYGVPGERRQLNRHAILHGSARRYGSQENGLKLFLLLVSLADALDPV
jgi:hypothetical protein